MARKTRGRKPVFPGYIKTTYENRARWVFFDSDGRIAKIPTRFLNHLQNQVPSSFAQGTVTTYASDLKSTLIWIRDHLPKVLGADITLDRTIELIEREQVERSLQAMQESGIVGSTLVRREVVLQQLFKWCTTQKAGPIRTDHPYSEVSDRVVRTGASVGSQRDIDEFVNFEMVALLLLGLHNECERVFFHFLFDVGPRISEAMGMTAAQLPKLTEEQRKALTLDDYCQLPPGELYLPAKIYALKKRGPQPIPRQVAISLPTLKRILQYHRSLEYLKGIKRLGFSLTDPGRPVFLTANGSRWKYRNANKQFRAAAERAHLPGWFVGHGLRGGSAYLILVSADMGRTFADRLKQAKKQLGHRWMSTLEKYYTTLPAPLLARFQNKANDNLKWKYLYDLREETYLGPKLHREKRGKWHASSSTAAP